MRAGPHPLLFRQLSSFGILTYYVGGCTFGVMEGNEMNVTGKHGWPLVPSTRFPGERTLACPDCSSTNITLTVEYPAYGSGPCGRGRLGDYGARNKTICNGCGKTAYAQAR